MTNKRMHTLMAWVINNYTYDGRLDCNGMTDEEKGFVSLLTHIYDNGYEAGRHSCSETIGKLVSAKINNNPFYGGGTL